MLPLAIYLDHAASTALRPEVRAKMDEALSVPSNPSSLHRWGRRASVALEEARGGVARALDVPPGEIHFVRGGTEASNLAILGRAGAVRARGGDVRVVVSAVEHRAVLDTLAGVEAMGGIGAILPVDARCHPLGDALEEALAAAPAVLSLMAVNNETGALPPVAEVGASCRHAGVVFHTDAVQAPGHIALPPLARSADLISLSGHKIGGPASTGVLRVRREVELAPLLFGGGQEGGLRPGTEDLAGAVGMAEALRLAELEREGNRRRLAGLAAFLEAELRAALPTMRVHGKEGLRSPHIVSVGIPGIDPELLLAGLDLEGIAASRGSACSSGTTRPSHVLEATQGVSETRGVAPLRLSFGRDTTHQDVARAAEVIVTVARRLGACLEVPA